jgi:hypothetical protein
MIVKRLISLFPLMLSACALPAGCSQRKLEPVELSTALSRLNASSDSREPTREQAGDESTPTVISRFCGDCHALPNPESFAREVWYDEIRKGYELYARSGRDDLSPPPLEQVLHFYRQRASEQIEFPSVPEIDTAWRSRFRPESVEWGSVNAPSPAISSIRWVKLSPVEKQQFVVTDMRDGSIHLVDPFPQQTTARLIGRVGNPARVTPGDLNQDGWTDLVVADLGSFNPYDHAFGQIVCLVRVPDSAEETANVQFRPTIIAEGLGRVADVAIGNFSGDARPDLVFAEFGHRDTGGIRMLTNVGGDDNQLNFTSQRLDHRPGTIQVAAHDWDADGQLDFAALVSQEFECVDLFINRASKFDRYHVAHGSDLTFGSVGIELADLDQDGDQDILYVNGDCFDNNFANRSHGIQWLENVGGLQFRLHRLADLPGAYRAVAVDIDKDADLDIVAVANLPSVVYPETLNAQNPASIVLLEQQPGRRFELRVLERGTPRYPALEVGDFDGNGKMDFAVGTQLFDTDPADSPAARLPRLSIWWQP